MSGSAAAWIGLAHDRFDRRRPMTAHRTAAPSFSDALAVYLKPRVLIVLFLGFSSGLPLALSGATLLVWMREVGVDLGTIGLFALVGTPYTVKFLWAPLTDALDVPLLSRWLGRRRGWLVFTQILLMAAIVFLGSTDPARAPGLVALGALLVATASATQDIVVDAFRVESLPENEQAAGMASYVAAYRIGMLVSTAGTLFLVSAHPGFRLRQAGGLALGLCGDGGAGADRHRHRLARHRAGALGRRRSRRMPGRSRSRAWPRPPSAPSRIFSSYEMAFTMLAFVVLFKFTDALSGAMTAPFVIDLGFTRNEYAAIVKGVGLAALLLGGFAGGFVARALPLSTSLWIGAILQASANLGFCWLAGRGHDLAALTFAITLENFTSAIGTVMFVAYLSALCQNPLHTATQYALLTALAAVGRTYLSSGAGFIAEGTGWVWFFVICALAGLPSLVLLWWLQRHGHFKRLEPRKN